MPGISKTDVFPFAIGMIGLGILSLIYRDFALQWQPVPATLPGREAFAIASGLLMIVTSLGLLFTATSRLAARILFAYLIGWLLLKVPALVVAPSTEAVWLGFGEIAVLLAGVWTLFARCAPMSGTSALRGIGGEPGIRAARILFGLALIPIGLSHIVYLQATASFVPTWMPWRTGWAYLTGFGQIACGVGVLLSILPRLAATIETAMLAIFALLVWAPAIAAAPRQRLPWTAFFITWVIGAAAWIVARNTPQKAGRRY